MNQKINLRDILLYCYIWTHIWTSKHSSPKVHTGSGAYPISYSVGTGVLSWW